VVDRKTVSASFSFEVDTSSSRFLKLIPNKIPCQLLRMIGQKFIYLYNYSNKTIRVINL